MSAIRYNPISDRIIKASFPYLFINSKTGFAYASKADFFGINFIFIKRKIEIPDEIKLIKSLRKVKRKLPIGLYIFIGLLT